MRRRFRWDAEKRALIEIPLAAPRALAPFVWGDLPAYESPVDGRIVDGRKARREDLKRSHSRPYEGREQEAKEAAKARAAHERQLDQLAEKIAHRAWEEAPERIRRVFRSK